MYSNISKYIRTYPKYIQLYPHISGVSQCIQNVSKHIEKFPSILECIRMYLKVSIHIIIYWSNTNISDEIVSKYIRTYPIVSWLIQLYQNISKCSFTKLLRCILSLCYSGLLGIVCWLAAERAIYDPKWLWDNEVLSSFLFQFWTLCETKNDTTTTAPQTTAAGCKLFQATVARWLGTVVP